MSRFQIFPLVCFILGVVFFITGFLTGETKGGIFIVFPFIIGSGVFSLLGFIFIFIGILSFIFGFSTNIKPDKIESINDELQLKKKTSIKGGGIVLIGPIPIIFGSNWKIIIVLIIIAIILILISYFVLKIL